MARITFQKRQKEMKRLEKARLKAERRAQRKLERNTGLDIAVATDSLEVLNSPPELELLDDAPAAEK